MQQYVGYGFNVNDISNMGLLKFMQAHAPEDAEEALTEVLTVKKKFNDMTKQELEDVLEDIEVFASSIKGSTADYIVDIICADTCRGLLWVLDETYIVFPPLEFPEDAEERCKYVKSAADFQHLITTYFPDEDIEYGKVWDGVEWADPCYYMD